MGELRLLDLFCCQGGSSSGYAAAGFDVTGVDMNPQPRYPFRFIQADALEYLAENAQHFDAIHASPPCQAYSICQRIQGNEHPDLIGPVRELLERAYKPYVIENVVEARDELIAPILLCGEMFGLRTYRHRLFETSFELIAPEHPAHPRPTTKMGRPVRNGENMHVVGNFTGVDLAREVMGMPWASRDGLREAIPPIYAEFVGRQLMRNLGRAAA